MERNREITVKGIGDLKIPVDFVEIHLTLEELDKNYNNGYQTFEDHILELQEIIQEIGFKKEDLKTSLINVYPKYENERRNDSYVNVFKGYNFFSEMKLCFDFDSQKLGEAFSSISTSDAKPRMNVNFTVKDKEAVKKRLLGAAAKDAKEKAQILCDAMGVKLGKLITINYNWDEIEIYSSTKYEMNTSPRMLCADIRDTSVDFTPDDISVEDDASFVWAIEDC